MEFSEELVELEEGSEVKQEHQHYHLRQYFTTISDHPHCEGGNPWVFLGCSAGCFNRLDKSGRRDCHWNRVDLPREHFKVALSSWETKRVHERLKMIDMLLTGIKLAFTSVKRRIFMGKLNQSWQLTSSSDHPASCPKYVNIINVLLSMLAPEVC